MPALIAVELLRGAADLNVSDSLSLFPPNVDERRAWQRVARTAAPLTCGNVQLLVRQHATGREVRGAGTDVGQHVGVAATRRAGLERVGHLLTAVSRHDEVPADDV